MKTAIIESVLLFGNLGFAILNYNSYISLLNWCAVGFLLPLVIKYIVLYVRESL